MKSYAIAMDESNREESVVEGESWVVDWRSRSAGEGREMKGKK